MKNNCKISVLTGIISFLYLCGYSQNCNFTFYYNHSTCDNYSASLLSFDFATYEGDAADIVSASWDFGNGNVVNGLTPTHVFPASGNYAVCVSVQFSNGCSEQLCKNIVIDGMNASCVMTDITGTFPCFRTGFVNDSTIDFMDIGSMLVGETFNYLDFGDGTSSPYTGMSVYHSYHADGEFTFCGVYTYTDLSCTDTICKTIIINRDINTDYNTGFIVNSNQPITAADVYAIKIDSSDINDIHLNLFLQQLITDGTGGLFNQCGSYGVININDLAQVEEGSYLLKAALDSSSSNYATNMPTYYGGSLFWHTAQAVTVSSPDQYCIGMILGNNPGGPGFIGGSVNEGANKTTGPGDPMSGIEILLLTTADEPVAYTYSDENGNWLIDSLAYGTYKVYPEVWGLPTDPFIVTISPSVPGINDISISINSNGVNVLVTDLTENYFSDAAVVFPNPSSGNFSINFSNEKAFGEAAVAIYTSSGSLVYSEALSVSSPDFKKMFELDLPSGIYFLNLSSSEYIRTEKVVVK